MRSPALPAPSPTPVPWTGSDLAARVSSAADGAETWLAAGTHVLGSSSVACSSKTVTVAGAGEGATIHDAEAARRFFALGSGCALVLRGLTLRNGKASLARVALTNMAARFTWPVAPPSTRAVAFEGNSATYVRAAPPRPFIEMRTESDAPLPSPLLALTTRHAMRRL